MRETIRMFRSFAARCKFVAALLALFMSGALLAFGVSAWHYGATMEQRIAAYDRQIDRLTRDIDAERDVNRGKLDNISDRVAGVAEDLKAIALLVKSAASTARSAATTAKGAAKNAAKANVTVKETRTIKAAPVPKRIVTREVEP